MTTVLVVGATGILRPATVSLAASGATVLAVARTRQDLERLADATPRVVPVVVDCLRPDAVAVALATTGRRPTSGLCYCPAADAAGRRGLAALVDGPLLQLLPSAWAEPGAAVPDVGGPVLQLGWTDDPPRWHSADEVSAAALDVLASGMDGVLGRVRPWTDRPT
jgi:NAD(P)-dependent dehydrogenase (short-subunit alcohol dehydrogenase family)